MPLNEPDVTAPRQQEIPVSRSRRFLKALGSFYAIAFLIAISALLLFAWLASEVLEKELSDLNAHILLWIHTFMSPMLTGIALTFTWIGSVIGVSILTVCFAILLYLRRRFLDMITLSVLITGGALFVFVLKNFFQQIRPRVFVPLVVETAFSFPSGHSTISFCFWGFLGAWLVRESPRELWRWLAAALCIGIATMVAASRLYLGVHWPTDVVAGMLLATFWISACLSGQQWMVARRKRRDGAVV